MSAIPSRSASPSLIPCDLAPCPLIDTSSGALRRARSRPCFVWTREGGGSSSLVQGPPSQCACAGVLPSRSDWLRVCACSRGRWLVPRRPPHSPRLPTPSAIFRVGSKDAGGSDWLRRTRPRASPPPGFSAPAAAITELPVVSARGAVARGPPLLASRGRVQPGSWRRLGRVHPGAWAASCSPRRSALVSAAAESSRQPPRCLHLGSALPRLLPAHHAAAPCLLAPSLPCSSAVGASVSELLALLRRLSCCCDASLSSRFPHGRPRAGYSPPLRPCSCS